jgi:hypothetical protein
MPEIKHPVWGALSSEHTLFSESVGERLLCIWAELINVLGVSERISVFEYLSRLPSEESVVPGVVHTTDHEFVEVGRWRIADSL